MVHKDGEEGGEEEGQGEDVCGFETYDVRRGRICELVENVIDLAKVNWQTYATR